MFDLDREVATWSASVHARRCTPETSAAELADHLYCEIDRGRAAGLSDEEAFRAAISRLGSTEQLASEHEKNRPAVCQLAARLDHSSGTTAEERQILIANALIWASLMIAFSLVLSKSAVANTVSLTLMGLLAPLWWASDRLVRQALRQRANARARARERCR